MSTTNRVMVEKGHGVIRGGNVYWYADGADKLEIWGKYTEANVAVDRAREDLGLYATV